jgi:hypothetical protein
VIHGKKCVSDNDNSCSVVEMTCFECFERVWRERVRTCSNVFEHDRSCSHRFVRGRARS